MAIDLTNISAGVALAYSVLGFAVVFLGLILLMIVIGIMARIMKFAQKITGGMKDCQKKEAAPTAAAPAPAASKAKAPGTAGEIMLHTVSDRDAAMIMAIVAHKMNRPLNELRFKSIKEVK